MDSTTTADYPVVELAGADRVILSLGDGRMFGLALPKPHEGPLPKRVQLKMKALDEDGVPEGAAFIRFLD